MAKYRSRLPQLSDRLFLTDAGMETFLIFREGVELPYFASLARRASAHCHKCPCNRQLA